MDDETHGQPARLHLTVGRLAGMAAGWKLRAMQMEACGVKLSGQFLRECAEELEAELQSREPQRTSWFRHEAEIERLLKEAQHIATLADMAHPSEFGLCIAAVRRHAEAMLAHNGPVQAARSARVEPVVGQED